MSPNNGTQLSVFVHVFLESKDAKTTTLFDATMQECWRGLAMNFLPVSPNELGNYDMPSFFFFISYCFRQTTLEKNDWHLYGENLKIYDEIPTDGFICKPLSPTRWIFFSCKTKIDLVSSAIAESLTSVDETVHIFLIALKFHLKICIE